MIFSDIKENRDRYLSGKFNCIPFSLKRFSKDAPGIIRGNLDCITANVSVGKTTFVKYLYVFSAIDFAIANDVDLHIIYFALEESKEQFEYSLLSYIAKKELGLRYNIIEFEAFNGVIGDEDLSKIDTLRDKFEQYMSYITVIDSVYNSYGMYVTVRTFARARGNFFMDDKKLTEADLKRSLSWNKYVPHNPEEFVIVVTDHVSEMHTSKDDKTLFDAIASWTKYQRHYICKRFNYNACAVHQQAAHQESLDNFKLNKLKPSLNGLADNKLAGRSYLNIYGLFSPDRHDIPSYEGYKTSAHFRVVNIIKQRYGNVSNELPIFFDGKTNHIKTMPQLSDTTELSQAYNYIDSIL